MSSHARVFLLVFFLGIGALQFFVNTEAVSAAEDQQQWSRTTHTLDDVGILVVKYVVLSIFLEIVLTLLFKAEQVFTRLQGKTWKTPVAIGFGLLMAWGLDLQIFHDVLKALTIVPSWAGGSKKEEAYSMLINGIDGFILAGGNHSFYRIFTKLGIHDPFKQMVRAAV